MFATLTRGGKSLRHNQKFIPSLLASSFLLNGKRNKITVSSVEPSETANVRRPTPILFLRTDENLKEWASNCQKKLSQSGYSSFDAAITLPTDKNDGHEILKACYQELSQATSELSFFPPLLIGKGETAWRICQKYVSNKPVSGLVLVQSHKNEQQQQLPSNEFEPFFPILMLSKNGDEIPAFLDGWVDHNVIDFNEKDDVEINAILNWMDEAGL